MDLNTPLLQLSTSQTSRWVQLLPKLALGIFFVGGVAAAILWITASGSVGQDLSILSLCVTFALMVTVMSIRELIKTGDDD